MLKLRSSKSL